MRHFCRDILLGCFLLYNLRLFDMYNMDIKNPKIFRGERGSYFGYSLSSIKITNQNRIVVGAPKTNVSWMSAVVEPGSVYLCDNAAVCNPVKIDDDSIEYRAGKYRDKKDRQWLGATLTINQNGPQLGVCAPLWTNNIQGLFYPSGMCFIASLTPSLKVQKVRPLIINENIWKYKSREIGYGIAGSSATFNTKDGIDELVMGAPMTYDERGCVVRHRGDQTKVVQFQNKETMSYIGYSITRGVLHKLRPNGNVIVGAPSYKKLGLFKVLEDSQEKHGTQLGSYFASCICAIDADNDQFDEVAVGAPMFTSNQYIEQGVVYVYTHIIVMGERRLTQKPSLELHGSLSSFSQFGSSCSNLGDVNGDGYNDLAVGAPFERGFGCMYIFNGGLNGLERKHSQRICGSDVQPSQFGFGWSISSINMDNSGYNDIAVGAFLSDTAILFYSRQVIGFNASLTLIPKTFNHKAQPSFCPEVNRSAHCIKVVYCVNFINISDYRSNRNLESLVTLTADVLKEKDEGNRVNFILSKEKHLDKSLLLNGQSSCDSTVAVIKLTRDVINPLVFNMKYDLHLSPSAKSLQPIANKYLKNTVKAQATFNVFCGNDVCKTDVHLYSVTFSRHYYIVGQDNPTYVYIKIKVTGEEAYDTVFKAFLPRTVDYIDSEWIPSKFKVRCSLTNLPSTSLRLLFCNLGNSIPGGNSLNGTLTISVNSQSSKTMSMDMKFSVSTSSKDIQPSNDLRNIQQYFKLQPDLVIKGEAIPEQVVVRISKQAKGQPHREWRELNSTQLITVHNRGPSTLPRANISFMIPVKSDELFACYYNTIVKFVFDANAPDAWQSCTVVDHFVKPSDIMLTVGKTFNITKLTVPLDSKEKKTSKTRTTLRCSHYSCLVINCFVENMPVDSSATMSLYLGFYEHSISSLLKDGELEYEVWVSANLQNKNGFAPLATEGSYTYRLISKLVPEHPEPQQLEIWIIIVSGVAGLLLFLILGIILWKCGFFKRKKKLDLEKRKRQSAAPPSTPETEDNPKTQPESNYTVSPSEEVLPELHNKEPILESKQKVRPASLAVQEDVEFGSRDTLPPPPPNL